MSNVIILFHLRVYKGFHGNDSTADGPNHTNSSHGHNSSNSLSKSRNNSFIGIATLDSIIPLPPTVTDNHHIHKKIKTSLHNRLKLSQQTTITGVGVAKDAITNISHTSTRALSNISSIATGGVNKLKSSISDFYSLK